MNRRSLILGITTALATPSIAQADSLRLPVGSSMGRLGDVEKLQRKHRLCIEERIAPHIDADWLKGK